MAPSPLRTAKDPDEAARRDDALDALWDWSYVAGAFVTMAATLWLAAAVWSTA
jgi:hypothetical protein